MLSPADVSFWQTTYNVSYYALLAGLFVSFIATGLTFVANNRLTDDLTERLTQTTASAGRANESAAKLEKEAADARSAQETLRSENLQTQRILETERMSRVELERKFSWRVIPDGILSKIVEPLSKLQPGGAVDISYSGFDPETMYLGGRIEELFSSANKISGTDLWKISVRPKIFTRAIYWEIRIYGTNTELVKSITNIFIQNNIRVINEPVPDIVSDMPGITVGGGPQSDVMIFIGSKRPPN